MYRNVQKWIPPDTSCCCATPCLVVPHCATLCRAVPCCGQLAVAGRGGGGWWCTHMCTLCTYVYTHICVHHCTHCTLHYCVHIYICVYICVQCVPPPRASKCTFICELVFNICVKTFLVSAVFCTLGVLCCLSTLFTSP